LGLICAGAHRESLAVFKHRSRHPTITQRFDVETEGVEIHPAQACLLDSVPQER
jgi:hypothetical protein